MSKKTIEKAVETIAKNSSDVGLVTDALKNVYKQGYGAGYSASTLDKRRAKSSQKRAADEAFKREMDLIDDIIKQKWL